MIVGGFTAGVLSLLLLAQGASGVLGTLTVGRFLDRYPMRALLVTLILLSVGLLGFYGFGRQQLTAVVFLALCGCAFSALAVAIQHRSMQVAPGSTDTASAGTSSAFNLGIAAGSFFGSILITRAGVRDVPLAGALLTVAALAIVVAEPYVLRHGRLPGPAVPVVVGRVVACTDSPAGSSS